MVSATADSAVAPGDFDFAAAFPMGINDQPRQIHQLGALALGGGALPTQQESYGQEAERLAAAGGALDRRRPHPHPKLGFAILTDAYSRE